METKLIVYIMDRVQNSPLDSLTSQSPYTKEERQGCARDSNKLLTQGVSIQSIFHKINATPHHKKARRKVQLYIHVDTALGRSSLSFFVVIETKLLYQKKRFLSIIMILRLIHQIRLQKASCCSVTCLLYTSRCV